MRAARLTKSYWFLYVLNIFALAILIFFQFCPSFTSISFHFLAGSEVRITFHDIFKIYHKAAQTFKLFFNSIAARFLLSIYQFPFGLPGRSIALLLRSFDYSFWFWFWFFFLSSLKITFRYINNKLMFETFYSVPVCFAHMSQSLVSSISL